MAKLSNNILGPFSGRIGNVVGSSWKGIPYLKSAHASRTKKISDKEKANRQKFKLAQEWLTPLLDFVRQGYKGYTPTVEGFVAAKSYLMKNAMEIAGASFRINPEKMKVSVGTLPLSENIAVKPTEDLQIQFTWDTTRVQGALDRDQVMMLAYDIEKEQATYTIAGEFRHTGSATLPAPCNKGAKCHVYLAFVAVDRSRQSDSIYLGEITI
ncbi:MAG: DUF6266 family protein [Chitinophagales bacterium]